MQFVRHLFFNRDIFIYGANNIFVTTHNLSFVNVSNPPGFPKHATQHKRHLRQLGGSFRRFASCVPRGLPSLSASANDRSHPNFPSQQTCHCGNFGIVCLFWNVGQSATEHWFKNVGIREGNGRCMGESGQYRPCWAEPSCMAGRQCCSESRTQRRSEWVAHGAYKTGTL